MWIYVRVVNLSALCSCAIQVGNLVRGNGEEVRLVRRTVIRYLVLSQVMLFRDISMRVRRRFPNFESLIDGGFLFEEELDKIQSFKFDYNKYWMPVNWAMALLCRHTFSEANPTKQYIDSAPTLNQILGVIRDYRLTLDTLNKFDMVPIPIAYPQVVFLAVRVYFVICLFSRQFAIHDGTRDQQENLVFPVMTILEFVFFVGWMKVAEALLNPLGEDDDDLECNWLIDKNIATGMAIVDEHYDDVPSLRLDVFADPTWQPVYSEDSVPEESHSLPRGSVANVELPGAHERVKMIHVDANREPIHKTSEVGGLRRKITTAFVRQRANSVQPMNLVVPGENEAKLSNASYIPSPRTPHGATVSNNNQFLFNTTNLSRLDEEAEYKDLEIPDLQIRRKS
uniref:Bestrophin homolog n=1 Tax=Caenorhabditis japonica TaxID=281687 RepID=A0A8R1HU22_CAEJA